MINLVLSNVPVERAGEPLDAVTDRSNARIEAAIKSLAFIRESPRIELNSYDQKVKINTDGSVDMYFGPKAPATNEANSVYTAPGMQWLTIFRFYGPEKAVFEKTWKLSDIEEIK